MLTKKESIVVFKITVSLVLISVYFTYPSIYTKSPPIIWNALSCNLSDKYGKLMAVGLFFGALGDITIEFSFLAGLLMFLVNHFIDIYAFSLSKPVISMWVLALGLLYLVGMTYLILPKVDVVMIAPVFIYAATLIYAACLATMRSLSGKGVSSSSSYFALIGSWLFVVSDSLLAYSIFIGTSHQFSKLNLIMITYYACQLCLSMSSYFDLQSPMEEEEEEGENVRGRSSSTSSADRYHLVEEA
jgi:alkenylglycerophosphocholine hydrolase